MYPALWLRLTFANSRIPPINPLASVAYRNSDASSQKPPYTLPVQQRARQVLLTLRSELARRVSSFFAATHKRQLLPLVGGRKNRSMGQRGRSKAFSSVH